MCPRVFPPKERASPFQKRLKNRSESSSTRSLSFELLNPPLLAQNGLKIHPKSTPNVATSFGNVATSFLQLSATSRRWFSTSRRCCSPLFLLQLRKVITLSYELRFMCSWYRWKALEVYNLSIYYLMQYELILFLKTSKYSSLSC